MGCGLGVALGVADCRPERDVLAVIGDGDLIMGASSLCTLSGLAPANLLVLVLDDGAYTITGGQSVIAPGALAAGGGALPGVAAVAAADPGEVIAALSVTSRPGVVLAAIDDPKWPGPSPFATRMRCCGGSRWRWRAGRTDAYTTAEAAAAPAAASSSPSAAPDERRRRMRITATAPTTR